MFIIFDLDGTLADCTHREHYMQGRVKDMRAFTEACGDDKPIIPLIQTLWLFCDNGHRVEIWTGRKAWVRERTLHWLRTTANILVQDEPVTGEAHRFSKIKFKCPAALVHRLRMQPETNRTQDPVLKMGWLLGGPRPDLVFEDRRSVVDMWRADGIRCCQVAPGDF